MPKTIFDRKNILITGGAGFIGSHLCDELVKENKVICVDNFISGSELNIDHLLQNPNFIFVNHNIVNPIDLESLPELERFKVKFQGIQEIYHLACPTSPKEFEGKVVDTALANSVGTRNVLDLAVKYNAKFLLTSSSVVYGARLKKSPKVKEEVLGVLDHLNPRGCYDEGKRFAETLTKTYAQAYSLDAKIARVFRTYGPRMRLRDGHMLPDFVYNALENENLIIYGDENFSSSLCYVIDVIEGLIKMMESPEQGPVNIGSDVEVKIIDVANEVIKQTGSTSKVNFEDPLVFMTPLPMPDISLAKEKFGWFPIVRLEDGIKHSIDYIKAHKAILLPSDKKSHHI